MRLILNQCGINPDDCIITNVVNEQPPHNNFDFFCQKEKPEIFPFSVPIGKGGYLKPQFWHHVESLYQEIKDVNLIIAFGNTATWAVSQRPAKISSIHGTFYHSAIGPKAISTWHPAAMLREYKLRPQMFADLTKASLAQFDRTFTRPQRSIHVVETPADVDLATEILLSSSRYAIDIETFWKEDTYQLSCIGFSPQPSCAYVFPFTRKIKNVRHSYWSTIEDEVHAWKRVQTLCTSDRLKLFQNKLFDIFVLWQVMRIRVLDPTEDTMSIQHATYPELPKSLAFLGALHTDEPAWKLDRPKGGLTGKAED
jgi:hypothetical protein